MSDTETSSPRATTGGDSGLTVAVTGPTGTFGFGLMPLLEAEPRVARVIGIARRPFDPTAHGFHKLTYRQGDVRDGDALRTAFEGADVVVHLAFLITGTASRETIRAVNVEGTLNALRAARAAGARRFVYASSVAAYGFHRDNPVGMREDWPTRPADRLFYAREKAELEHLLERELEDRPPIDLYLLRPPVVVGPHAVGAKGSVPGVLTDAFNATIELVRRLPVPVFLPTADVPMQLIHEDDVGQALLRCALGDGPPGAYNIAGDGEVTGRDIVRELGFSPLGIPAPAVYATARALARIPRPPFVPPATEWIEALSHPAIMDTSRARRELGWEPRYTALEALRDTLRRRT